MSFVSAVTVSASASPPPTRAGAPAGNLRADLRGQPGGRDRGCDRCGPACGPRSTAHRPAEMTVRDWRTIAATEMARLYATETARWIRDLAGGSRSGPGRCGSGAHDVGLAGPRVRGCTRTGPRLDLLSSRAGSTGRWRIRLGLARYDDGTRRRLNRAGRFLTASRRPRVRDGTRPRVDSCLTPRSV